MEHMPCMRCDGSHGGQNKTPEDFSSGVPKTMAWFFDFSEISTNGEIIFVPLCLFLIRAIRNVSWKGLRYHPAWFFPCCLLPF
jgi:hypothetical protein